VGIACFSVGNPVLVLCQFSDSATYPRTLTKLLAINPTQILIPGVMGRETMDGKSRVLEVFITINHINQRPMTFSCKHVTFST
jgi:hypothetical protein